MEFLIGQVLVKGESQIGKATRLSIMIPLNGLKIEITIRHAPDAPSGQTLGIELQLQQDVK